MYVKLFLFSIVLIVVFVTLFFKDVCDCLWLGYTGTFLLCLSLILGVWSECVSSTKEPLGGFEAWTERIDYIADKHLKNYNEDQQYQISNAIIAMSIKMNKNSTKEEIDEEMLMVRDDLLEKGIRIHPKLLHKIYEEAGEIYKMTEEHSEEIFKYFQDIQKQKEENPDVSLEEMIMPYV